MFKIGFFAQAVPWSMLGLLTLGMFSCYPGSLDNVAEGDVVATNYNRAYFESNSPDTYFMPDTVGVISEATNEAQLTREEMDFILGEVADNFADLGYQRLDTVDAGNQPDVVVLVSALVIDVRGTGGCIPWWPGWGWYPWYPDWGWGPGYCYPSYIYSYSSGSLVIDMLNPVQNPVEGENIRVWNAGLNGLLRSSVGGNQAFVQNGIQKAFELSPYLSPN